MTLRTALAAATAMITVLAWQPCHAEVIEEIVAWVNDDIITRSDFEERDQAARESLYGTLSGEELDRQLREARLGLLRDMISERLLTQQAERLYDLKRMEESLLKNFKAQENVTSDDELRELLAEQGMTIEDLRRRLIEFNAPQSVIQYDVRDKISVTDAEVEAYYANNPGEFSEPERVTFREIVFLSEGRGSDEAMRLAAEAVEELKAGADFEALATERSEAASRKGGGLLGPFRPGELNPEIEALAFSLPVGQVSDPIRTVHGAHVIRVEQRDEPQSPSIEEVRERIYRLLEREKFRESLEAYLRKLWSKSEIEVARGYLDRISPDYRSFVKEAASPPLVR